MEDLIVKEWLEVYFGFGYGYGMGDGSGYGTSFGSGYGRGYGYGSGDGYGSGYGMGDGSGFDNGTGDSLKKINGYKIYKIDDVPTIIIRIKNNIAQGYIVNQDLTLEKTYIVKGSNMFAHGRTIKEALASLQEKIFEELDTEEKINEFRKEFKPNEKYSGHDFFKWHHILTGSCLQGRLNFVKNNNIDLDKSYTVKEFIEICENDYGSEYIKELKKYYFV